MKKNLYKAAAFAFTIAVFCVSGNFSDLNAQISSGGEPKTFSKI